MNFEKLSIANHYFTILGAAIAATECLRFLFEKLLGLFLAIIIFLILFQTSIVAQQFVTDNYISMPYGTVTTALTVGPREVLILPSFALIPNWEFFIGSTLVWEDEKRGAEDHFSTIINVKWEVYENESKTGGLAMLLGTGASPGYLSKEKPLDSFRNYHYVLMATLPFLNGQISWDLNPGVLVDLDSDDSSNDSEWHFTYATRVAIYGIVPSSAIVGEVYGSAGDSDNDPEYKAGIRWEPEDNLNVTLTYGGGTGNNRHPGLEIGVLVYSQLF